METISVRELSELLKKEPFKFICLTDDKGRVVVAYNTPKITVERRKDEIIKKLHSTICPDGIYFLNYKENIGSDSIKSIAVMKGNVSTTGVSPNEPVNVRTVTLKEENVLSYSNALSMMQEISDLKVENQVLKNQIEDLNSQLDDLLDEGEEGLSESPDQTFSMFEKLFEKATPIIDKYFEQEDEKIQLAKKSAAPSAVHKPTVAPTPAHASNTPAPAPIPVTQIFSPVAPSAGATPNIPDTAEEDKELEEVLQGLQYEDLKSTYDKLKVGGDLNNLKKFIRILKQIRPDDLRKIVAKDIE